MARASLANLSSSVVSSQGLPWGIQPLAKWNSRWSFFPGTPSLQESPGSPLGRGNLEPQTETMVGVLVGAITWPKSPLSCLPHVRAPPGSGACV